MMDTSDQNQKIDLVHSKANRDQFVYEVRKNKHEEFVRAKRMKFFENSKNNSDPYQEENIFESEGVKKSYKELNDNFYAAIELGDPSAITQAVRHIREKISTRNAPNLKELYESKLVNPIAKLLDPQYREYVDLQKESLWVVANTFSGEFQNYKELIDDKMIDILYGFISNSTDNNIIETAFYALGNLAGDHMSNIVRKILIESGIIDIILKYYRKTAEIPDEILKMSSWTISNLTLLKDKHEKFFPVLGIIEQYIFQKDPDICANGCWAIANLTNSTDEIIEKIATDYIMKKIINLLESPNMEIKSPALRAIGNISSGKSAFTKKLWNFGVFKKLEPLIDCKKPGIRRESLWSFSNFLAEDANLLGNMLEANLIQKIISKIFTDVDDIKVECAICLANALQVGTWQQAEIILGMDIIKAVSIMLGSINIKVIDHGLNILENILWKGEVLKEEHGMALNYSFHQLEQNGILQQLEKLQNIEDEGIYKKISDLIDKYLPYE